MILRVIILQLIIHTLPLYWLLFSPYYKCIIYRSYDTFSIHLCISILLCFRNNHIVILHIEIRFNDSRTPKMIL